MSAVFGILRFDGDDVSSRDLERMGNVLAHRGPDGRKFAAHGAAGLGHCLLRVNNEDMFEAQPLRDRAAGLVVAADCRIDNREELAARLGIDSDALREMPDSAFIMRAYRSWGEDCARHLTGDFAFAIWDAGARRLLLGRDPMGQRYVHYYRGKDFFAFATEIKALWALSDVPRALNEQQLGRYLVGERQPRGGATLFKDIFGLPGGSVMTVGGDGGTRTVRYWQPHAAPEHCGRDADHYVEAYRQIVGEAVACRIRRLIAPPALCFSAGYDSAAIAGLCRPVLTAQQRKVHTISSVLPKDYAGPLRDVRPWVEFCRRDMPHLDVHYLMRDPDGLLAGDEKAFWTSDGIPGTARRIIDDMFAMAAGAGAHLVMEGIGGDSTVNPRGGGALADLLTSGRFRRFLSELRAQRRASGQTFWRAVRSLGVRLAPGFLRRAWFDLRGYGPRRLSRFVAPDFLRSLRAAEAISFSNPPAMRRFVSTQAASLRMLQNLSSLPRPHHANEAAAHGLELTRPFLDRRVVEFGLAIPTELQVVNGRARDLACRALADVYPPEYQSRARHQDAYDPDFTETLRHALPEAQAELSRWENRASLLKYIRVPALARACAEALAQARAVRRLSGIDAARAGALLRAFTAARYIVWFRNENR